MKRARRAALGVAVCIGAAAAPTRAEPREAPSAPNPHGPRASPTLWLAAFTEGALGLSGDGFYNQLTGGRIDYRPDARFAIGAGASYVNLKGAGGRAHNVLAFSALEWRAPLGGRTTLPIRLAPGYLPKNGPWLKAALGIGQPLEGIGLLTLELLAPTLWVVGDQTLWSLNASVELAFAL